MYVCTTCTSHGSDVARIPAFVALEDVFATVAAHARVGRHTRAASWTLQRLGCSVNVVEEVVVLNHQVARHDRKRKLNLHFRLTARQHHLLGAVPEPRPKHTRTRDLEVKKGELGRKKGCVI